MPLTTKRPAAGISEVLVSATCCATGVSSHPFSYGKDEFTAMAVNRAVSSHPACHRGRLGTNGLLGWGRPWAVCIGVVIARHVMPAMMGSDMLNQPPNPECEAM